MVKERNAGKREKKEIPSAVAGKVNEFVVVVLIFGASAIALVWLYFYYITPSAPQELNVTGFVPVTIEAGEKPASISQCLAQHGIDARTVIFIYEDACPFSQRNAPFVRELEVSGYSFYWAKASDPSSMLPVSACLAEVASLRGTPEFVCPAKPSAKLGAFDSKSELLAFVEECVRWGR